MVSQQNIGIHRCMLYTRNKDCFKKTVAKTEHKGAHRHIINMVKQVVGRDLTPQSSNPSPMVQNICINNQPTYSNASSTPTNHNHNPKQPILCESVYSSGQGHQHVKDHQLIIEHVIDYSIRGMGIPSQAAKAQKQYLSLLEDKLAKLQEQLKAQKQSANKEQQDESKQQVQKLIRFYHRARNTIVLQSVELLECKNIISQLKNSAAEARLKAINTAVAKSEQLLQVYRRSMERGSPRKPNQNNPNQIDTEQLKDLCQYQQKTIEFLRKQAESPNQFNEVRLLRHEINRVCAQNEGLLGKLAKLTKKSVTQSPIIAKNDGKADMDQCEKLVKELNNKQNQLQRLQVQMDEVASSLKKQIKQKQELENEKKIMMDMLQSAKFKNYELQANIVKLELQLQKYEQQMHDLKKQRVLRLGNEEVATTEELCRELKAYPRYFKLLMSIINQYETKVSELQNQICKERELKQKFKQWMAEVYRLLESAQLPPQVLQKHKNQLISFDSKMDCSKIQKFLRQIRALSIGIDAGGVREMQAELEEYIVSLEGRYRVINEADCQDGSSVAVSETFTDRDFQQ